MKSDAKAGLRWWIVLSVALAPCCTPLAAEECRLFLLRRAGEALALERVDLADGELRRVPLGPGSEWVTFVLPLGAGKSADLVQAAAGPAELEARCGPAGLEATVQRAHGGPRALPPVRRSEIESYDLRVNVRSGRGGDQVFRILGGRTIEPASGPALDLFGGRLPLGPDDFAITLETSAAGRETSVRGSSPLEFDGEHLFVRGRLARGIEGWWVVDLAASRTVVRRQLLPAGQTIVPFAATEYAESGPRAVGTDLVALGGAASGLLGVAGGLTLEAGALRFDDAEVAVMEALPPIGGRTIDGIVGLDLLRRAPRLELDYAAPGSLRLLDATGDAAAGAAAVPFTVADRHLFATATLGGERFPLVVDSGAKVSLLSPALAARAGLAADPQQTTEIRGLGGAPVDAPRAEAAELWLGEQRFTKVPFHLAPLPVIESWGLRDAAGILGNDFFRRFRTVRVDFDRSTLELVPH